MMKPSLIVLVPLLGLLACSQPAETPPPPAADAGVDADPPASCDAPCASTERCIDGACTPADVLYMSITETTVYQSGSVYSTDAAASACGRFAAAAPAADLPPPLAVEGACQVLNYQPGSIAPPASQPAAAGGVKITTPTGMLPLTGMGTDCALAKPGFVPFAQSGVISFDGDGAGHFPAFHLEVTPPPPIELASGPVVRGQPISLTWQAADTEGLAIEVVTIPAKGSTTTPPWIRCEIPDTGAYTIPASLTALLDAKSTFVNMLGTRAAGANQAPASTQVVILAAAMRVDQLLLDYTP